MAESKAEDSEWFDRVQADCDAIRDFLKSNVGLYSMAQLRRRVPAVGNSHPRTYGALAVLVDHGDVAVDEEYKDRPRFYYKPER